MTDYTEQEIDRLHYKLASIYRRGRLTPAELIETKGLWARIERLNTASVATKVKEAKRIEFERAKNSGTASAS